MGPLLSTGVVTVAEVLAWVEAVATAGWAACVANAALAAARFDRAADRAKVLAWLTLALLTKAATWAFIAACRASAMPIADGTIRESSDSRGEISFGKARRFSLMIMAPRGRREGRLGVG